MNNDTYGYFVLFFSIYSLSTAVFTFGLDTTVIKFKIEEKREIIKKIELSKRLEKIFEMQITQEIYESLRGVILDK